MYKEAASVFANLATSHQQVKQVKRVWRFSLRFEPESQAFPHDHEVLCNRALCYLNLKRGQEALQDAAQSVNLKPDYTKG